MFCASLWAKVEKEDMWFILGARVNKCTISSHTDDQWIKIQADRTEGQCTEDKLIENIQHPKIRRQSQMRPRRGASCHVGISWDQPQGRAYGSCSRFRCRFDSCPSAIDCSFYGSCVSCPLDAGPELTEQTAGGTLAKRQINHHYGNNKEERRRKTVGLHRHPPTAQHLFTAKN
jgi:hypothetical protein